MRRARVVLAGVLAASALSISTSAGPAVSSASASPYVIWGLEYCLAVPTGTGGWTAGCRVPFAGGNNARAIVSYGFLLNLCLYTVTGMFGDPGCSVLGGTATFRVFSDPPALTMTMTGGAAKVEGEIAGVKVTIACASMEAKEPEIESGDKKTAAKTKEAALIYKECKVESSKPKTVEGCQVNTSGKPSGTVQTTALESELVENTAQTKVENLFKPKTGETIAEAIFTGCKNSGLNGTFTLKGSVLTEGGSEDEIANVKENTGEGDGEAVEKPKLNFEASSKKYLDDESKKELETKLEFGGSAATLKEEAKTESKFEGTTFKSTEGTEEETVEKGVADLGLDKE
jgi:hypothetical protein